MRRTPALLRISAAAGVLLLSACGQSTGGSAGPETSDTSAAISVVTSTNVYSDIVRTIGGDQVEVTPIITKISQDPHSYEPTVRDRLAVSEADLVVSNGGGYDPFLDTLTDSLGLGPAKIIDAVEVSGENSSGSNEHVWYDMPSVAAVADLIASRLGDLDAENAELFTENAERFKADIGQISEKLVDVKSTHAGEGVALTEPLPAYMLEAAGLVNRTPEDFLEAVEEGNDAPAGALKDTIDLMSSDSVRFLAFNNQTSGPQTESVREAADAAKLPVVEFSETLPEGVTFVQWMNENADNIESALQP